MNFQYTDSAIERIYSIQDELISSNIIRIEEEINQFIKNDRRDVVIDLMQATKIDSMAIAAIIRIKNRLTEDGRKLHITNPNETVYKVLELAGLDQFLLG